MPCLFCPLFFALMACNDDAEGPGSASEDPQNPDSEVVDNVSPTIVSTFPEVGARGVSPDTELVIAFSEPMDAAVVESNLDLTDLGPAEIVWNDAVDTLTLIPNTPFDVVQTDPDADANPTAVRVVVGPQATDFAGNQLGIVFELDFTIVRELSWSFAVDQARTRTVTPSGFAFAKKTDLVVGDSKDDDGYRSTLTFDLDLSAEYLEIVEATLELTQLGEATFGDPYGKLGKLTLDHVSFGEMLGENQVNAAFNSSQVAFSSQSGIANAKTETAIDVDVTDAVIADLTEGRPETQYLLYFDGFTNIDGETDAALFSRDDLALRIRFTAL